MAKGTILVVEPDDDIRNMQKVYFGGQGYLVLTCTNYEEAFEISRKQLPSAIVTELDLPTKSGWELLKDLRATTRTSHIPIVILTSHHLREDKIKALELGVDDYVTKPFDVDELGQRVEHAYRTSSRIDDRPIRNATGLPTGYMLEKYVKQIIHQPKHWVYLDVKITDLEAYREVYGWERRDKVLVKFAELLKEVWQGDYLGHPGGENFIIITEKLDCEPYIDALLERFKQLLSEFYDEVDLRRGFIVLKGQEKALIRIAYGLCDVSKLDIKDIREVIELAAEDRRKRMGLVDANFDDSDILTEW